MTSRAALLSDDTSRVTLQRRGIRASLEGGGECLGKVRLLQILLASLTFNYFETQPHAADPHDGRRPHAAEEDEAFSPSSRSKSSMKNMATFRKDGQQQDAPASFQSVYIVSFYNYFVILFLKSAVIIVMFVQNR